MRLFGFGLFVKSGCVGIGRGWTTLARGEDELSRSIAVASYEEHIARSAVQQRGQNLVWCAGAVRTEDTLVDNTSGDLHSRLMGDLAEDLVEAGIIGGDREGSIRQGDLGMFWLLFRGSGRGRGHGCWRRCRESGSSRGCRAGFGLRGWSSLR